MVIRYDSGRNPEYDSDASVDAHQESTSDMDCENAESPPGIPGSETVVSEIEDMVLSFLRQVTHRNAHVEKNSKPKIVLQIANRAVQSAGAAQYKQLAYPRKSATGSARPFAQLFRVMDMVHEAVTDDIPVTKRDMYYKDVALFGTQRVVDNLVDDLAATFNVERSNLNVRATSKGLICGSSLLIRLRSGEVLQPTDTDGTLIPVGEDIQSFSLVRPISWVLVVEKDAIFQALCRLQVVKHEGIDGAGLLITGKGYPDLATRHLVKTLSDCLSEVPILALVDADAYGLDILSVYKNGSRSLQHEAGKLAADRIQWIGVRGSELSGLGVSTDHLLPISQQDEKMALAMLRRPKIPAEWRRELSRMLFTRRKAEIEVLSYAQTSCVYEYLGNLETTRHLDADPLSHLGNQMHSVSHSQTTQCASASHPLLRYVIRKIQAAL